MTLNLGENYIDNLKKLIDEYLTIKSSIENNTSNDLKSKLLELEEKLKKETVSILRVNDNGRRHLDLTISTDDPTIVYGIEIRYYSLHYYWTKRTRSNLIDEDEDRWGSISFDTFLMGQFNGTDIYAIGYGFTLLRYIF